MAWEPTGSVSAQAWFSEWCPSEAKAIGRTARKGRDGTASPEVFTEAVAKQGDIGRHRWGPLEMVAVIINPIYTWYKWVFIGYICMKSWTSKHNPPHSMPRFPQKNWAWFKPYVSWGFCGIGMKEMVNFLTLKFVCQLYHTSMWFPSRSILEFYHDLYLGLLIPPLKTNMSIHIPWKLMVGLPPEN